MALLPFRQYDEHDVINLFTFNGTTGTNGVLLAEGSLVKISTGWSLTDDQVDLAGNAGGLSLTGKILSTTWSLTAKVEATAATDTAILGMTLVAMRDLDENGEKLIYNPRKAAEMGVVVPGQSIPILTRGLVLASSSDGTWAPAAGGIVYAGASGQLTTTSSNSNPVGTALGGKDANGFALIKLDL